MKEINAGGGHPQIPGKDILTSPAKARELVKQIQENNVPGLGNPDDAQLRRTACTPESQIEQYLREVISECEDRFKAPNMKIDSFRCYWEGKYDLAKALLNQGEDEAQRQRIVETEAQPEHYSPSPKYGDTILSTDTTSNTPTLTDQALAFGTSERTISASTNTPELSGEGEVLLRDALRALRCYGPCDLVNDIERYLSSLPAPVVQDVEQLARQFHDTYIRLAPQFGYEPKKETVTDWSDLPENNKALMLATVKDIAQSLSKQSAPLQEQPGVSGSLPLFGDLIYEQDLPDDISDAEYSQWYKRSYVVDGVRMGYPLQRYSAPLQDAEELAVGFAEWIDDNCYEHYPKDRSWNNSNTHDTWVNSTKALYQLYLQSLQHRGEGLGSRGQ